MTIRLRGRKWYLLLLATALTLSVSFFLDPFVQEWIAQHQYPGTRLLMQAISRFGDWPEHIALGLALLGFAWWGHRKDWMQIALAMILACAMAGAVARVGKVSAGRARPSVHTDAAWTGPSISSRFNAFPSGHTAASAAFFASLAFASWRIGVPLMMIPVLIALSRMYVAAHYLSDVVCAALIGILIAYLVHRWFPSPIRDPQSKMQN